LSPVLFVHDSEDGGTIFIDGFWPSESDQDLMISLSWTETIFSSLYKVFQAGSFCRPLL
jgi:hypothetical protein